GRVAEVTASAALNCSSNCAIAAANVCLREEDSSSFERARRLARRSRSLNHIMDVSSIRMTSVGSGTTHLRLDPCLIVAEIGGCGMDTAEFPAFDSRRA